MYYFYSTERPLNSEDIIFKESLISIIIYAKLDPLNVYWWIDYKKY